MNDQFTQCVDRFMNETNLEIPKFAFDDICEDLSFIGKVLKGLEKDCEITTSNPSVLTAGDVQRLNSVLKENGHPSCDVSYYLDMLDDLCMFCGNSAVRTFKRYFYCLSSNRGVSQ